MPNDNHPHEITDSATTLPEAELLVKEVRIQNFRSLVDVTVPLEETSTYLVGENNTGKSSLLLAIHTACGGRKATVDDLLKKEDGIRAKESVIDIIFHSKKDTFDELVGPLLPFYDRSSTEDIERSGIRTKLQVSTEGPTLVKTCSFLQWNQEEEEWDDTGINPSRQVIELFTTNYIKETRDLAEDLNRKTSDWGRVLSNLDINIEQTTHLEEQLFEISKQINESSPTIKTMTNYLEKITTYQSGIDSINLEPIPTTIEEIVHSIDVTITKNNRKLPMRYQGLGSRNLAYLIVYRSLLELKIGLDQGIRPHVITLLEEPEAHLHPQAQISARRLIEELPGQTIMSTHSNVLIGEIHPSSVRIIRSTPRGPKIQTIDIDSAKKIAVFRRYVERPLGEIFFARLVVFVEGTAERISLPVLLEPVLGSNPSGKGITFIAMKDTKKDTNNEQLEKAVNALETLGDIPWLVFVDNDDDGWKTIEGIKGRDNKYLDENHYQVISSGKKQLEQKQLEQMFIDAGFHQEIQHVANTYLPRDDRDPKYTEYGKLRLKDFNKKADNTEYLDFLHNNKGWVGELIAREAVKNQRQMPEPIHKLADAINRELNLIAEEL